MEPNHLKSAGKSIERSDNLAGRTKMTPEGQENHLISLAYDLVETRLREGTASAQETVHFLKLGSTRNRAEMERLQEENKLLRAKTESLNAQRTESALFEEAIKAMQRYRGTRIEDDEDDYYD